MLTRPTDKELKRFDCYYSKDTDFAAHARLLQSKWRTKHNYPINTIKKSDYGNFVETEYAKREKVNYLTDNIKKLVSEKIIEIRRKGGLVGEPRIWNNLLSSQPLCFNLFGELHYDLNLATKFFDKLFPNLLSTITKVDFEYSSRRGKPDNSAFDVFIEYDRNGVKGFLGIEVKYQENLFEETQKKARENFEKHESDYINLTINSNVFKSNAIAELQRAPIAQIWRDHLLCFNMQRDYDEGFFVFLYPFDNKECRDGVNKYRSLLISDKEKDTKFCVKDLAEFIRTLRSINKTDWTKELEERYLGT